MLVLTSYKVSARRPCDGRDDELRHTDVWCGRSVLDGLLHPDWTQAICADYAEERIREGVGDGPHARTNLLLHGKGRASRVISVTAVKLGAECILLALQQGPFLARSQHELLTGDESYPVCLRSMRVASDRNQTKVISARCPVYVHLATNVHSFPIPYKFAADSQQDGYHPSKIDRATPETRTCLATASHAYCPVHGDFGPPNSYTPPLLLNTVPNPSTTSA